MMFFYARMAGKGLFSSVTAWQKNNWTFEENYVALFYACPCGVKPTKIFING